MRGIRQAAPLLWLALVAGCTPVASAKLSGTARPPWEGPVFITTDPLLAGVEYEIIGGVEVRARSGYGGSRNLYPQLADEARRVGANVVIGARGGRRVAGWSWAAPYAGGTAVRVPDPQALRGIAGSLH